MSKGYMNTKGPGDMDDAHHEFMLPHSVAGV